MTRFIGRSGELLLFTSEDRGVIVDSGLKTVVASGSSEILVASHYWTNDTASPEEWTVAEEALVFSDEPITASAKRLYTIPKGVQNEAKKALKWRKEEKRGGTSVGMNTARTLSKGGQIGIEKVRHVAKYFARHEVDKQGKGWEPGEKGFPSNGRIAWALWGGDAAWRWASAIVERENKNALTADAYGYKNLANVHVPDMNAFENAYELDEDYAPEFLTRVRLDGSGMDRLYKIDHDGEVYLWDDGAWDNFGRVGNNIWDYDRELDDSYDECEKSHIVVDPESAIIIAARLHANPYANVTIEHIDEDEARLAADAIYDIDWDFIDHTITAAGTEADGVYSEEERSKNATQQVRDKGGKFAKMGGRVMVGGDPRNGIGKITGTNRAKGTVTVLLDNGKTVEVPGKGVESLGGNVPTAPKIIEEPIDVSGILGEPRTPADRAQAQLPGTLPAMTQNDLHAMISDWPAWVQGQRDQFSPIAKPNDVSVQGKDSTGTGGYADQLEAKTGKRLITDASEHPLLSNWLNRQDGEGYTPNKLWYNPLTAAAKSDEPEKELTPTTSDVQPLYMAVVDKDDPRAVLALISLVPASSTKSQPMVYSRKNGKWVRDPQTLSDLNSATPPPVVPLDETVLNDVLKQVDESQGVDKQEPEPTETVTASLMLTVLYGPTIVAAGGLDRNRGNAERLRRYWTTGKGAAKIRWGKGGDWKRCVRFLAKHLGERAKGYCQLRHKERLGYYTSTHAKMIRQAKGGNSTIENFTGVPEEVLYGYQEEQSYYEIPQADLDATLDMILAEEDPEMDMAWEPEENIVQMLSELRFYSDEEYALVAAGGGWRDMTDAERSAKAKRQLRDKNGRFMEMGGMVKIDLPGGKSAVGKILGVEDSETAWVEVAEGEDYPAGTHALPAKSLSGVLAVLPESALPKPSVKSKTLTELPKVPEIQKSLDKLKKPEKQKVLDKLNQLLSEGGAAGPGKLTSRELDILDGESFAGDDDEDEFPLSKEKTAALLEAVGIEMNAKAENPLTFDEAVVEIQKMAEPRKGGIRFSEKGWVSPEEADSVLARVDENGSTSSKDGNSRNFDKSTWDTRRGLDQALFGKGVTVPDKNELEFAKYASENPDIADAYDKLRLADADAYSPKDVELLADVLGVDAEKIMRLANLLPANNRLIFDENEKSLDGFTSSIKDYVKSLKYFGRPVSPAAITKAAQRMGVSASDLMKALKEAGVNIVDNPVKASLMAAGGLDRNRGNAEQLRRYWTAGKGGMKIRWGTPNDWTRCVRNLEKYLGPRAKGYCALRHKEMNGMWPGDKRNRQFAVRASGEVLYSDKFIRAEDDIVTQSILKARRQDAMIRMGLTASASAGMDGAQFVIPLVIPEEIESGDGRMFKKDAISIRELPLPLMWQIKTSDGHAGSVVVGRIDRMERTENGIGNAYGVFDTGEFGKEAERMVRSGFLRGVSADMDKFEAKESSAKSKKEDATDDKIKKEKILINKARVMGVTIVPKPAFQECTISLVGDNTENISQEETVIPDGVYVDEVDPRDGEAVVASAMIAGAIPNEPPVDWFDNPKLSQPTPLTIDNHGRVYGHIAAWNVDHIGMVAGTKPPRSRSNYQYFHTGVCRTDAGTDVPVGQLTLAGGHADITASAASAAKHYDDTASAIADVHAGEDSHGIWVAGALRPGTTPEQVRALRASAPSGDWRPINGRLELVAVCQVNVPGFPIARAMVAGGQITALVAAGAYALAKLRIDPVDELSQRVNKLEAAEKAPLIAAAQAAKAKLAVIRAGGYGMEQSEPILVEALENLLADVVTVYFRTHAYHWNVKGQDFAQYHELFEEIYQDIYGSIDPIAENIRKLGHDAPISLSELVDDSKVNEVELSMSDPKSLAYDLYRMNEDLVLELKAVFSLADAINEQGIADFIAGRIDMHQKWCWQLRASVIPEEFAFMESEGKTEHDMEMHYNEVFSLMENTGLVAALYKERKFTTKQRQNLADKGFALPDGSYPIENVEDLKNAIQAYGRASLKKQAAVKKHIVKRARALGSEDLIPKTWGIPTNDPESNKSAKKKKPIAASAEPEELRARIASITDALNSKEQ